MVKLVFTQLVNFRIIVKDKIDTNNINDIKNIKK